MVELILSCIIKKERRGGYSSLCPELDIASRGDSIEEAKEHLKEAVAGHLKIAKKEGILLDILDNLGITEQDLHAKHGQISVTSFSSSLTVPLPQ